MMIHRDTLTHIQKPLLMFHGKQTSFTKIVAIKFKIKIKFKSNIINHKIHVLKIFTKIRRNTTLLDVTHPTCKNIKSICTNI